MFVVCMEMWVGWRGVRACENGKAGVGSLGCE